MSDSNNNVISGNTVSNNGDGIALSSSSSNNITDNIASNNSHGIFLCVDIIFFTFMNPKKPNNNTIYNNYFDNTYKTFDGNAFDSGNNTWNITKIRGTNIVGGPYLGGNYWCDYNGTETSGDKLGDTLLPYNCSDHIKNGGDYHPLIKIPKIILKASKDGYGLTLI